MPPRASSRLNLLVLRPPGGGPAPEAVLAALGARPISAGGERLRRPGSADSQRFFANAQGGFRVYCPVDGGSLVDRFVGALEAWRGGGARTIHCNCGAEHDLAALDFRPPAGFAEAWIEARDVGSMDLDAAVVEVLMQLWPGFQVVGSRG